MQPFRTIGAAAPIRICDNGGWTDTWVARHGKVFNIAVEPRVFVKIELFPRDTRNDPVVINAENYGVRYAPALDKPEWGPHPLLEASLKAIPPQTAEDIEITIHSTAPPAASTGTSAAVVVALLGALNRLSGGHRTPREIAYEAHAVETVRLGHQSGIQDQLCSALGGINFIDIKEYPQAEVSSIAMPDEIRLELERRLALVYLGRPHNSSAIHESVMRDLERLGPDCRQLNALRQAAEQARDAAVRGDLEALATAMRDNTAAQAELHAGLVSRDASRVIEIANAHGAAGWKVNGAGGDGGSITLLSSVDADARRAMLREIEAENRSFASIPIALSTQGLDVTETPGETPTPLPPAA